MIELQLAGGDTAAVAERILAIQAERGRLSEAQAGFPCHDAGQAERLAGAALDALSGAADCRPLRPYIEAVFLESGEAVRLVAFGQDIRLTI